MRLPTYGEDIVVPTEPEPTLEEFVAKNRDSDALELSMKGVDDETMKVVADALQNNTVRTRNYEIKNEMI